MNFELHRFLNDTGMTFAENEPRPPIPGEENDSESNGRISSRSSESRKSQISAKSHSPGHGSSPKLETNHPLPRKSSSEALYCPKEGEEVVAPLGFEPEGGISNLSPFAETSAPSCLRWATNIECLLEDGEGVKLFKLFLDQDQNSHPLEFWFACQGLKLVPATDENRIQSLVKLIYKKYIKGNQLTLKPEIKKCIADKIKIGTTLIDQGIFNDAQCEVELILRNCAYPEFLKSDLYLQYLQNADGESPKVSDGSSGCPSARPLSAGLLPTLHEEEELQQEDIRRDSPTSPLSLTPGNLVVTMQHRALRNITNDGFLRPRSVNPYHAYHMSYAPTSAQDSASEMQSVSSDAQTDETLSQTDGSIDSRDNKKWKKRVMKKNAQLNRQASNYHHLIPRQDRVSRDGNLAETNPEKFSILLTEKLLKVKEEVDKLERVRETMKAMEAAEDSVNTMQAVRGMERNDLSSSLPLQALLSFEREKGEENPQSILDDHMSRIWDSSDHHTPLRSPGGQYSPQPWPTRKLPASYPLVPVISASAVPMTQIQSKSQGYKRRDASHLNSSIPTMFSGKPSNSEGHSNFSAQLVYHNNSAPLKESSKPRRPSDSDTPHLAHLSSQNFVTLWNDSPHATGAYRRSTSDARNSHNGDSGVSMSMETNGAAVTSQEPLVDKVLHWMMRSEVLPSASSHPSNSTDCSDKTSSQQKRSQHKQSTSPQQHKNHKRAPPSRLVAAELGERLAVIDGQSVFNSAWQTHGQQQAEPVTRRGGLEEDLACNVVKSRSFSGAPVSDNRLINSASARNGSSKTSDENSNISGTRPLVSVTSPSTEDVTVIGYYFCGEPIPYRTTVAGHQPITLAQFKNLIMKKGNYRYFFKKVSDEFDSGIVHEEVMDDNAFLPFYDGKIICKVEKADS